MIALPSAGLKIHSFDWSKVDENKNPGSSQTKNKPKMASKKATCYIFNVNHSMSLFPDNAFEKSLQTITSSIEDRVSTIQVLVTISITIKIDFCW